MPRSKAKNFSSMDINCVLDSQLDVKAFVLMNFNKVEPNYKSEIYPRPINYILKEDRHITFCNIEPIRGWALIRSNGFVFYLVASGRSKIDSQISQVFTGIKYASEVEMNGANIDSSIQWKKGQYRVILTKFRNRLQGPPEMDSNLIIISSMDLKSLIQ
jgi:hypothetical protein